MLICVGNRKFVFQVEEITLTYTDNAEELGNIKEDCCPGSPHILFFSDDRQPVYLKLINNIPQNGFFSISLNVVQFDTVEKLADKIRRDLKLTKGKTLCHERPLRSVYF